MNKFFTGNSYRILFLFFSLLFPIPALYSNDLASDSATTADSHEVSHEDLIRGERLFYGLVYQKDKSVNCASCHNTRFVDTINWNPDAYDISAKYKSKTVKDLTTVLLRPRAEKMKEMHKNFDLAETDIIQLKAYMDQFAEKGLKPEKAILNNLIIFIIITLLVLVSLADIIVIKRFRYKWVHLLILLGGGVYITNALVKDALAIGRSQGYSPDQPIKFSHKIHAGQNGTDCLYCHSSAETSKSAGIPSGSVCMNCHLIVRNGTRSGAFEIAKVIEAYEKGESIDWIRIYNMPDHVYFNHSQHVGVAGLACQECHGPVEEMDRVIHLKDFSMGWCINCHRDKALTFHDNKFYEVYKDKMEGLKKGDIDSVTVEMVGGTECMKCHY